MGKLEADDIVIATALGIFVAGSALIDPPIGLLAYGTVLLGLSYFLAPRTTR